MNDRNLIKKLTSKEQNLIKAYSQIDTTTQCLLRLVDFCLTCNSTAIAIRIDFNKFRIKVICNGQFGDSILPIASEKLAVVGCLTRKCFISYVDQNSSNPKKIELLFKNDHFVKVKESKIDIFSNGFAIFVDRLFHQVKVRQKVCNVSLETSNAVTLITYLSLANYQCGISLRDEESGKMYVHSRRTKCTVDSFSAFFGHQYRYDLVDFQVKSKYFEINLYFGLKEYTNSRLQFLFINKTPVVTCCANLVHSELSFGSRLTSFVCNMLVTANLIDPISGAYPSVTKNPVFILFVNCSDTDVYFIPSDKGTINDPVLQYSDQLFELLDDSFPKWSYQNGYGSFCNEMQTLEGSQSVASDSVAVSRLLKNCAEAVGNEFEMRNKVVTNDKYEVDAKSKSKLQFNSIYVEPEKDTNVSVVNETIIDELHAETEEVIQLPDCLSELDPYTIYVSSSIDSIGLESQFEVVPKLDLPKQNDDDENSYSIDSFDDLIRLYSDADLLQDMDSNEVESIPDAAATSNSIAMHGRFLPRPIKDRLNCYEMMNINSQNLLPTFNNLNPNESSIINERSRIKFDKVSVESLEFIGQVDSKFIACKLLNSKNKGISFTFLIFLHFLLSCIVKEFIVLIDQHAADERIRLERSITANGNKFLVRSTTLDQPIDLNFSLVQLDLISEFKLKFETLGFDICVDLALNQGRVISYPMALIENNMLEKQFANKMQILICNVIESLRSTYGSLGHIPTVLLNQLKSKACRGAIKFGTSLSDAECNNLIESLKKCLFPFICAHGRPSIVPLLELPVVDWL